MIIHFFVGMATSTAWQEALKDAKTACRLGDLPMLQSLVDAHALDESELLRIASSFGQVPIVSFLLERGEASVAAVDADGWTPLLLAVNGFHGCNSAPYCEVVSLLATSGADVNGVNAHNDSAIMMAVVGQQYEVVHALLDNGADPNMLSAWCDSDDMTSPTVYAAGRRELRMLELLVRYGGRIDVSVGDSETTAFHMAAIMGNIPNLEFMLQKGVDINLQDTNGDTALHCAIVHELLDTATFLMRAGADVNLANNHKYFPLYNAVFSGKVEFVRVLLSAGASVSLRSEYDDTVVELARELKDDSEKNEILKLLLSASERERSGPW